MSHSSYFLSRNVLCYEGGRIKDFSIRFCNRQIGNYHGNLTPIKEIEMFNRNHYRQIDVLACEKVETFNTNIPELFSKDIYTQGYDMSKISWEPYLSVISTKVFQSLLNQLPVHFIVIDTQEKFIMIKHMDFEMRIKMKLFGNESEIYIDCDHLSLPKYFHKREFLEPFRDRSKVYNTEEFIATITDIRNLVEETERLTLSKFCDKFYLFNHGSSIMTSDWFKKMVLNEDNTFDSLKVLFDTRLVNLGCTNLFDHVPKNRRVIGNFSSDWVSSHPLFMNQFIYLCGPRYIESPYYFDLIHSHGNTVFFSLGDTYDLITVQIRFIGSKYGNQVEIRSSSDYDRRVGFECYDMHLTFPRRTYKESEFVANLDTILETLLETITKLKKTTFASGNL